jgi:hypothetical protein
MVERGRGLGFLHEPAPAVGVGDEIGRKDLDRHLAVQLGVEGAIYDSHSSTADLVEDPVVREGSSDHLPPVSACPACVILKCERKGLNSSPRQPLTYQERSQKRGLEITGGPGKYGSRSFEG